MAHFAQLDENNIVTQVISIDNVNLHDADGNESEAVGIAFCKNFKEGTWVQTSYNNNFRKQYAGVGMTYDAVRDEFVSQKPYASWTLDGSNDWQAPITKPDDGKGYRWDEEAYQADNSEGWVETPAPPAE